MAGEDSALISVQEVARLWAVSDKTVIRAIEAGQLSAARIRRSWRIRRADAERLATPQTRGRTYPDTVAEVVYSTAEPPIRFDTPERIVAPRPSWETQTTPAAPSAAGRSRSAGKKRAAQAAT